MAQITEKSGRNISLYQDISNKMLSEIRSGRYALGDKLPSHTDLIEKYGVSLTTIRQAIADLEKRGVVRREHGRGCFVSLQPGVSSDRSPRLRTVGLIFERTNKPADAPAEEHILLAFANACRERQIRLFSAETDFDSHRGGKALMETFDGIQLDGVCVFLHEPIDAYKRVEIFGREFRSSVVIFPGPAYEAMPIDCIDVDLRVGVRQLMKYFLYLGHQRIAYVGSHIAQCLAGDEKITGGKWQAYRDVLEEAGIEIDTSLIVDIPSSGKLDRKVKQAVVKLIKRPKPASAILAANDLIARQVLYWLWEEGISVPKDVSLAGTDDVSLARQLVPPLTTVRFPFTQIAKTAIAIMEQRLSKQNRPIQKVTIPTELIVRESTGRIED